MHKPVRWQIFHPIFCQQSQYQGQRITIHYAHQIHETGIAHESRVGMEKSETWNAQQYEYHQGIDDLKEILKQVNGMMEYRISQ
jgi:hypothetical protein